MGLGGGVKRTGVYTCDERFAAIVGLDPHCSGTLSEYDFGELTTSAVRERFADNDWGKEERLYSSSDLQGLSLSESRQKKIGERILGSWRGCTDAIDRPAEGMGGDGVVGLSVEDACALGGYRDSWTKRGRQ